MEVGYSRLAPTDYEGATVRNYASRIAKEMSRTYTVERLGNRYEITRTA
mgnify:CR=1 FL=1